MLLSHGFRIALYGCAAVDREQLVLVSRILTYVRHSTYHCWDSPEAWFLVRYVHVRDVTYVNVALRSCGHCTSELVVAAVTARASDRRTSVIGARQ